MFVSFPMFSLHLSIIFPKKNMDFSRFSLRFLPRKKPFFDAQSIAEAPAFARAGLLEVPKNGRFLGRKDGSFRRMKGIP